MLIGGLSGLSATCGFKRLQGYHAIGLTGFDPLQGAPLISFYISLEVIRMSVNSTDSGQDGREWHVAVLVSTGLVDYGVKGSRSEHAAVL